MRRLARRLFRLFVDSAWLAGTVLAWLALCALLTRLGVPGQVGGGLLLLGVAGLLGVDVLAAAKPK